MKGGERREKVGRAHPSHRSLIIILKREKEKGREKNEPDTSCFPLSRGGKGRKKEGRKKSKVKQLHPQEKKEQWGFF